VPEKGIVSPGINKEIISQIFGPRRVKSVAPGWWYLQEMISKIFRPEGIKIVWARLESKGSQNAFKELKCRNPEAVNIQNKSGTIEVEKMNNHRIG